MSNDPTVHAEVRDYGDSEARSGSSRRKRMIFWGVLAVVLVFGAACLAWTLWTARRVLVPRYTAKAALLVAAKPPYVLFPSGETEADSEAYRATQEAILKDSWVLQTALRPQVWEAQPRTTGDRFAATDELPNDQRAKLKAFSDRWGSKAAERLKDIVRVSFNGEVMEISVTSGDPVEAAALVNAVVRAYYSQVVGMERANRRRRLDQLHLIYSEKEQELRNRVGELRATAEQLGASDSVGFSAKQQFAIGQSLEMFRGLVLLRSDLERTRGDLTVLQTMTGDQSTVDIPDTEVDAAVQVDPTLSQVLTPALAQIKKQLTDQMAPGVAADAKSVERLKGSLETVQRQWDARREILRQGLKERRQAALAAEVTRVKAQVGVLEQMVAQWQRDMEKQTKEAEQLGRRSVEIEMIQIDLKHLNETLSKIAAERERLRIELNSDPRVQILGDRDCYSRPAAVPEEPDR